MPLYYIEHVLHNLDNCRIYGFYKEDLEMIYPKRNTKQIEKIDEKDKYGCRYLPYILVNDQDEYVKEIYSTYYKEENWKEEYFRKSLDNDKLSIKPVSIEDLDFIYSDTIYFVYIKDSAGSARKVFCAHEKDLSSIFSGYEIFKTKYNLEFSRGYIWALPYIIQDGKYKEVILSPCESDWKDDIIKRKKLSSNASIYPTDPHAYYLKEAEELEKIEKEWRESLGGKSVLEHLADIVSAKKAMEEDPEIEAIEGITRADVGLKDSEPINNIKDSDFDEDDEQINNEDDLPF